MTRSRRKYITPSGSLHAFDLGPLGGTYLKSSEGNVIGWAVGLYDLSRMFRVGQIRVDRF